MSLKSETRVRINFTAFGQSVIRQLFPDFDEALALEMEKAYQFHPEFLGTRFEDEPEMIKAYHLHKEVKYLSERYRSS